MVRQIEKILRRQSEDLFCACLFPPERDRHFPLLIEGDIQGTHDAEVISALDVPVIQINTEVACHLDANMVSGILREMPLDQIDLLVIENVGNLVCPAEFDVGEDAKVMLLSITEGDDKRLKYPLMFQKSKVLILNKMDLAPYLDVDLRKRLFNRTSFSAQELTSVDVLWQQGLELGSGVGERQLFKQESQVGVWLQAVCLGGLDETV